MEFGTSSGGLGSAQLAELDLDIMGRKQSVRVGVSETIPHDVLIGLDFADCPEMAAEVYRSQQAPNVSMVKTRSRTKAQLLNMPTVERMRGGTLRHQRSPRGFTDGVQEPSSHLFLGADWSGPEYQHRHSPVNADSQGYQPLLQW